MAQYQKCGIIFLACFGFIVAFSYLFASVSNHKKYVKNRNETPSIKRSAPSTPLSISLKSLDHGPQKQLRSFKDTFLTFPWTEYETAVVRNFTVEGRRYTKLFIEELTYFVELEPLVPIEEECKPPALPSPSEINCTIYPEAFNGVKRTDEVKVAALIQFGFDVDVLEIHMNELYGVVDIFFIIESTHAHYGSIKKPLIWESVQRQQRFAKFPVVHFIVDDAESLKATDKKWSMETLQEQLRWQKFLQWNEATHYFNDEDVIGFGDADEIPSRSHLNMFKYCEIKGESVDFGIWFPFGHISQAFRSDFPIRKHPFTLGDPTYYTLASAKASLVKNPKGYPSRRRGKSPSYILGGIHMTHYGYLPFQLVKYVTATEGGLQTLKDVQKISKYLKVGDISTMEVDFAKTPETFKNRIKTVDLSDSEMKDICILPWFYDCNRERYPVWEDGHDTRLDKTREL